MNFSRIMVVARCLSPFSTGCQSIEPRGDQYHNIAANRRAGQGIGDLAILPLVGFNDLTAEQEPPAKTRV